MKVRYLGMLAAGAALAGGQAPAHARDLLLGEIFITGANFCPRNTAEANGQLLSISSNTALFSLLGTTYGGNGRTTFALPDLRGRAPVGRGNGPGLAPVRQGAKARVVAPSASATRGQGGTAAHGETTQQSTSGEATGGGTLGLRYCIVTGGVFPARN